jgi:hypothetical protein
MQLQSFESGYPGTTMDLGTGTWRVGQQARASCPTHPGPSLDARDDRHPDGGRAPRVYCRARFARMSAWTLAPGGRRERGGSAASMEPTLAGSVNQQGASMDHRLPGLILCMTLSLACSRHGEAPARQNSAATTTGDPYVGTWGNLQHDSKAVSIQPEGRRLHRRNRGWSKVRCDESRRRSPDTRADRVDRGSLRRVVGPPCRRWRRIQTTRDRCKRRFGKSAPRGVGACSGASGLPQRWSLRNRWAISLRLLTFSSRLWDTRNRRESSSITAMAAVVDR